MQLQHIIRTAMATTEVDGMATRLSTAESILAEERVPLENGSHLHEVSNSEKILRDHSPICQVVAAERVLVNGCHSNNDEFSADNVTVVQRETQINYKVELSEISEVEVEVEIPNQPENDTSIEIKNNESSPVENYRIITEVDVDSIDLDNNSECAIITSAHQSQLVANDIADHEMTTGNQSPLVADHTTDHEMTNEQQTKHVANHISDSEIANDHQSQQDDNQKSADFATSVVSHTENSPGFLEKVNQSDENPAEFGQEPVEISFFALDDDNLIITSEQALGMFENEIGNRHVNLEKHSSSEAALDSDNSRHLQQQITVAEIVNGNIELPYDFLDIPSFCSSEDVTSSEDPDRNLLPAVSAEVEVSTSDSLEPQYTDLAPVITDDPESALAVSEALKTLIGNGDLTNVGTQSPLEIDTTVDAEGQFVVQVSAPGINMSIPNYYFNQNLDENNSVFETINDFNLLDMFNLDDSNNEISTDQDQENEPSITANPDRNSSCSLCCHKIRNTCSNHCMYQSPKICNAKRKRRTSSDDRKKEQPKTKGCHSSVIAALRETILRSKERKKKRENLEASEDVHKASIPKTEESPQDTTKQELGNTNQHKSTLKEMRASKHINHHANAGDCKQGCCMQKCYAQRCQMKCCTEQDAVPLNHNSKMPFVMVRPEELTAFMKENKCSANEPFVMMPSESKEDTDGDPLKVQLIYLVYPMDGRKMGTDLSLPSDHGTSRDKCIPKSPEASDRHDQRPISMPYVSETDNVRSSDGYPREDLNSSDMENAQHLHHINDWCQHPAQENNVGLSENNCYDKECPVPQPQYSKNGEHQAHSGDLKSATSFCHCYQTPPLYSSHCCHSYRGHHNHPTDGHYITYYPDSPPHEYTPQGAQYHHHCHHQRCHDLPSAAGKSFPPLHSHDDDNLTDPDDSDEERRQEPPKKRGPGRPPKPENERKRKAKKSGRLWEFIRNLLLDPSTCPSLVRWEDPYEGVFKIIQSDVIANKWGMRKNNEKMNYEKLSRAMRYYYKAKVFEPVLGKRLVYKFGANAKGWRPLDMENPNFQNLT